jgi:signal transduction histidine kinase
MVKIKEQSIYWQISRALLSILILSTVIGTIFEMYSVTQDLPQVLSEQRSRTISSYVGALYSRNKGWELVREEIQYLSYLEDLGIESESLLRYIIRDIQGNTIFNSFNKITEMSDSPLFEGPEFTIYDYPGSEAIGTVVIYLSEEFLKNQTLRYAGDIIRKRLIPELIMLLAITAISIMLAKRIGSPIKRLTDTINDFAGSGIFSEFVPEGSKEIQELSLAYNQMAQALIEQKKMRNQLIADLAHDLNNPLHVIMLEAKALKDNLTDPKDSAEGILASLNSIENLVYDLELLAEKDQTEYQLKIQTIYLQEFIYQLESIWKPRCNSANKVFRIHINTKKNIAIPGDRHRLLRAVENLIENAIRYNKRGDSVSLSLSEENKNAILSICDDGHCIPEEIREKIFERRFRSKSALYTHAKGSGLGLSIVRKIIQLHGGSIILKCGEQWGNCFQITIPKQDQQQ